MRMGEAYRGPRAARGPPAAAQVRSGAMALDPRTPVLVGVGQVTERPDPAATVTERAEPVELMARRPARAAEDAPGPGAGDRLLARAQSLRIMVPLSWRYVNPGLLVARRLGVAPAELALTAIGGNNPQTVVNPTARAIAAGRAGRGPAGRGRVHLHPAGGPPRPRPPGPALDQQPTTPTARSRLASTARR